ncbi:MAG: MlaD family protein [Syntrophales bacterium]|nr:MlaD family protein [Syntrophales bacterium]
MARSASKFTLGLFVIIGVMIGVVFMIWVGASKYFEKGEIYVTYFDESVQGLQVDSSVKYRGVEVGRVMKIRVAPDNRLVEVVMKIQLKDLVKADLVSQLKSAGITGIVFIELDRKEESETVLGPGLAFKTEYPIIASRSSDIKQIMAGLSDIYEKIQMVDFEGISNQTKKAAKSVDEFFNSRHLAGAIQNLESGSAVLESTMQKIDKLMAEGKIDLVIVEAQKTLAETRQLVARLKEEVRAMKLTEKSEKAGRLTESLERLTDNLDRRTQKVSGNMETVLRKIRQNSEQLNNLLEKLQNKPSDLIFGGPVPSDDTGEEAK